MAAPRTPPNPRKRKGITVIDLTNDEDVTPRLSKVIKPFAGTTAPATSSVRAALALRGRPGTATTTTIRETLPSLSTALGSSEADALWTTTSNVPASSSSTTTTPTKKTPTKKAGKTPEKRPRRYRDHPPNHVVERMYRCRTQKMFVVDRERVEGELREVFKMAGTTGNVYTVIISNVPTCDCPDSGKMGTCKHILYIMLKVLRAPSDLVYQAGLLTSELETIFSNAPPPPSTTQRNNRKPLKDEDCPICYSEFSEKESIVWCRAQCGSNIHETCFKQWAGACSARGASTTCVMCRQPWDTPTEDVKEKLKKGEVALGRDGYCNVADELGLSRKRDQSTYNRWYDEEEDEEDEDEEFRSRYRSRYRHRRRNRW